MAGAGRSVDETRTLISSSVLNQAHVQSKLDSVCFMEPLIPRMWQESHRDWAMRTAMLMQENIREEVKRHYVL